MSEHKKRAEMRAKNSNPINFTCGKCHQVKPYDKEKGLWCPDCDGEQDGD